MKAINAFPTGPSNLLPILNPNVIAGRAGDARLEHGKLETWRGHKRIAKNDPETIGRRTLFISSSKRTTKAAYRLNRIGTKAPPVFIYAIVTANRRCK
jgi:hypothetical protein